MTKGRNKALCRRKLRKAEKNSTMKTEKMLGNCVRRNYGGGITR